MGNWPFFGLCFWVTELNGEACRQRNAILKVLHNRLHGFAHFLCHRCRPMGSPGNNAALCLPIRSLSLLLEVI